MQAIAASDLSWLGDADRARTVLAGVGQRMNAIARSLDGGKVGPISDGIAVEAGSAKRQGLSGWAENDLVSFVIDVRAMGGDRWDVEAEVYVPCEQLIGCGQHLIESKEALSQPKGVDVLEAVDNASRWLLSRASTISADRWRGLDPHRLN